MSKFEPIHPETVAYRLAQGWDAEEARTRPIRKFTHRSGKPNAAQVARDAEVELDEALERMPWAYYRIDSIDEHDGPEARILIAFPLAQPITKTDQYTRAASLLWNEIGIGAKSTGAHSATFLFAPYLPNPTVSFHDKDCAFLDAAQYVASNQGNWVMVERDEAPKPTVEITDDGLWEMPVRGN